MDAKLPPTPTLEEMMTMEQQNRAHRLLLEQWGEEAPDTRDEHRHPEDFCAPAWSERYEE